MKRRHFAVALTGASGAIYGLRLCSELLRSGARLTMMISSAGEQVLVEECGCDWRGSEDAVARRLREYFQAGEEQLSFYGEDNLLAPVDLGLFGLKGLAAPADGEMWQFSGDVSDALTDVPGDMAMRLYGERLDSPLVPRVHVGPLVPVHLDADEVVIEKTGQPGVLV